MKKKETDRTMLGLSQEEVALLLKLNRAQWSMYESGKRNLPSSAELGLKEMILYMLSPEAKSLKNLPKTAYEDDKIKKLLEKRLKENEFQLMTLSRKINTVQEKLEKFQKAVQLMAFLNSPEEVKKAAAPQVLNSIETVAVMNFRKTKAELYLLQLKHELLLAQQECLQKALNTDYS